jgi:hypothetical protein
MPTPKPRRRTDPRPIDVVAVHDRMMREVPMGSGHIAALRQSSLALNQLFEAIKHEGEIRAINSGRPAAEWENHLTAVLRKALYVCTPPA